MRTLDALICVAVVVVIIGYLAVQPYNLGVADESLFLVEAKRILAGEVLYRDVFYHRTPGFHWMMALIFAVAGTTLSAARVTMIVVHAATAVALYLTSRRLRVGRGLSAVVPVAFIALGQAAWPFASPHWVSTSVMALLLLVMLWLPWRSQPRWLLIPGLLTGLLMIIEHQKGAVFALGLAALVSADGWLRRHLPLVPLLWFAVGVAAVTLPVFAVLFATAGFWPVADQLVLHALFGYRVFNKASWGDVSFLTLRHAAYTFPTLLKWLPLVIPIDVARLALGVRARRRERGFGDLLVLTMMVSLAAVSILYFPDFIHIAFVAPLFFVAWAELVEAALRYAGPFRGREPLWSTALAAVLLVALAVHLWRNMARDQHFYPLAHDTPFGRLAFEKPDEIRLIERVDALLSDAHSTELFAYPGYAALYLTTPAHNPTPFELLLPSYNSPEHIQQALAALESKKVPYVVLVRALVKKDDPVAAYVAARYQPVADGEFNLVGRPVIFERVGERPGAEPGERDR